MKKHMSGSFLFAEVWSAPPFILLAALFLCGGIAGSFAGRMTAASAVAPLATQMTTDIQNGMSVQQMLLAAAGAVCWQAAAVIGGALPLYSLWLSALCMVRGFSLAFSAAALLHAKGAAGVWLSLAASGAAAVLTIPCLLLTSAACFCAAQDAPRGRYWNTLIRYRGVVLSGTGAAVWAQIVRLPVAWMIGRWIL